MTVPITAIIPCKDEKPHIQACIDSLRPVADDILIADSGSTDGTLEIVQADPACRVIQRHYRYSADFKNWAIPQARHQWVLLLDADERMTPGLIEEVLWWKRGPLADTDLDAFDIRRESYVLGRRIRHSGWQNDSVKRLFRRQCRYEDRHVHASLDVAEEQTGRLEHPLEHHTYRSLAHFAAKTTQYSRWGAEDLRRRGKRSGAAGMTARPVWRFLRQYVMQAGFLDGRAGLLIGGMAAYGVFLKYAMLWEMERQAEAEQAPRQSKRAA